jgi:VWFA-related protein
VLTWLRGKSRFTGEVTRMLALRWSGTWSGPLFIGFALSSLAQQTTPASPAPEQSAKPAPNATVRLIPRSDEERQHTSEASHHIILNVLVTDPSGKAVTGLSQDDFTILDNGQPQKISSFRPLTGNAKDQPLHVIFLLDAVNNSARNFASERKAVEKFLAQSRGSLPWPIAIAHFSDFGAAVSPPSHDANALLTYLKNLPGDVHQSDSAGDPYNHELFPGLRSPGTLPTTAQPRTQKVNLQWEDQNQRFLLSITALNKIAVQQEDVPGRVIVIWIGPGWPLLSGPGFLPDTPEIKSSLFDHIADLSTEIRVAQMTLDTVTTPDLLHSDGLNSGYYSPFMTPVTASAQANAADLALPVLATQSGGQVLDDSKDIAAEIAAGLADADSWYALSFESTPSAQPDEYRTLQVKVNKPGLTTRTNTAYYAEP